MKTPDLGSLMDGESSGSKGGTHHGCGCGFFELSFLFIILVIVFFEFVQNVIPVYGSYFYWVAIPFVILLIIGFIVWRKVFRRR